MNENHIINQIHKDEKVEIKKTTSEYVNEVYKQYLNTLNNEEKRYLNVEDERVMEDEKWVYTSEIGFDMFNDKLLHVGGCNRSLYFKMTGAIKSEVGVADVETYERNQLVKDQWLKKLIFTKLLTAIDDCEVLENDIRGVKFKATDEGHIKDYVNDKTFTLLIKPVNDTAYSIKDRLWSDRFVPKPILEHLPEAIMLLLFYKKPVKILYVGKNNPELVREFNLGASSGELTVDGEVFPGFNIAKIFEHIATIKKAIENKAIPPRGYVKKGTLNAQQVELLRSNSLINKPEADNLRNGKEYENFRCVSCKFNQLCNSIDDSWVAL